VTGIFMVVEAISLKLTAMLVVPGLRLVTVTGPAAVRLSSLTDTMVSSAMVMVAEVAEDMPCPKSTLSVLVLPTTMFRLV